MGKKSIKVNYLYNLTYQIVLLLTPFITTPYISRVLGADGIGTVSFAESIVSYFVLFGTLGITTYGQREISYVQDSRFERSIVFWNTKIFEVCTASIALIAYILFSIRQNSYVYLILSLNLVAVIFDITWFLQGLEEFKKIVFRNMVLRMVNIIYVFTFVRTKDDVLKYAFGLAFFTVLGNASLWLYLPKYIEKVKLSELKPFKDTKTIISLFIPTVAIQVYTVLDKTMIGMITQSSFENGYYEQASKICKMVLTLVTSLGTVMIPRIGYYFSKQQTNEVKYFMYRGYRFVWFLGLPLALGLCFVSHDFVPWFFGSGYDKVASLLSILAFLIVAIGINNVTGMQYLIPTKRQNIFTITVIIGACTNLMLNALLIPKFESIGAAIASVTAETVIAVVQIIFVRKELEPSMILRQGKNYYIAGAVMSIVLIILSRQLTSSILYTMILVFAGSVTYFVMLLILRDDFFISNVKNFYRKVKRK